MRSARVVVAPNWLGDCVMALPVLRAIRRARPRDPLAVLAPRGPAGFFRAEGSADTVLVRSGLLDAAWRLRRSAFREAWLLPTSFRSAVAPFLAGVPERLGYETAHREALRLPLTADSLARADAALGAAGVRRDRPLALLAPGAAFGETKRWPAGRYGGLADILTERGFSCATVIGPREESLGA